MGDLKEYKEKVRKLRELAREENLSDGEVTRAFEQCFERLERRELLRKVSSYSRALLLVLAAACVYLSFDKKVFTTTLVRNLQNSIYPGLKILRRIAVPIVHRYPYLSEFYDEWCLLENPYFQVSDIECWPCTVVKSVPDLTGKNVGRSFNPGIPYTRSEKNRTVSLEQLYNLYWEHAEVFDRDASRIMSSNFRLKRVRDLMLNRIDKNPTVDSSTHVSWRINRMEPARIIRKLFPKPASCPEWWEQSIEKFVLIDEARSAAYSLPNPECSNVVIRCAAGARLITMLPSPECSQACQPSTILLTSGNTLWYNWWYWRPVSLPVTNATEATVTYVTSFC